MRDGPKIERLEVGCYTVPTESPESDGTLEWDATAMALVEVFAGGKKGLGYTYSSRATAALIQDKLKGEVVGGNAMDIPRLWTRMVGSIRNLGHPGICAMAVAAVDTALWDLKARLLDAPLASLLGLAHERLPVYGSGGFTSYSIERLQEQLAGWASEGIGRVKMKVGRAPEQDGRRVEAARAAIGGDVELFVDANGAYSRKEALEFAFRFRDSKVSWFEEPVLSEDLEGLRLLRDQGPPGMDISAGEYGFDLPYFDRMLRAGAVDVLQADITRCGGLSEFLRVGALCSARGLALSCHTAPALHLHPACSLGPMIHLEYFYDHVRIERMFFDGAPAPEDGALAPDLSRPGHGLELKREDAEPFAV